MRIYLSFLLGLLASGVYAQNNLLDNSTWTAGTGSVPGFTKYGSISTNLREMDIGPHGSSVLVWKGLSSSTSDNDGGWNSSYISNIDHNSTYRLTVWMKKTVSTDGKTYFGFNAQDGSGNHSSIKLDGSATSNPYFIWNDLPQLDQWYLLVAFVHHSGYTQTTSIGGIYDLNGTKVVNLPDFKMSSTTQTMRHRVYLRLTDPPHQQFHYDPTIYEVNGQEPSIQELIDGGAGSGGGSSLWSSSGSDIHYTDGNVSIGTMPQNSYKLAVDGSIHTREVHVDSDTWPDYVFEKDYDLQSLAAVSEFIKQHGHLKNIPSAEEVEKQGIRLGEMNRLLFEKTEELTLYLIEQHNRYQELLQRAQELDKLLD